MKKYDYRVSYANAEKDIYTMVVTSTSRNPKVVLDEVVDAVYEEAVRNGELKVGEFPTGMSILLIK